MKKAIICAALLLIAAPANAEFFRHEHTSSFNGLTCTTTLTGATYSDRSHSRTECWKPLPLPFKPVTCEITDNTGQRIPTGLKGCPISVRELGPSPTAAEIHAWAAKHKQEAN